MKKHVEVEKSTPGAFNKDGIAHFSVRLKELIGNGPKLTESTSHTIEHLQPINHINKNLKWDNLISVCAYSNDDAQQEDGANDAINEEFVLVPGYHIQVSAGHGTSAIYAPVKRYLAFRRKYIQYRKLDPNKLAVIFAKGDPMIKDNDSLLIDLNANKPLDGKIFVVRLGDELYAKRVQKSFDGSLRLISDNKEYSPIEVSTDQLDQLCIIGRVVQRSTDL
ncbi:helix-turn-helix transcriptional regulator [Photobacterium profundum]|uniref:Prophage MuSo1, transcriptional regulator, Cro/CI family n=1 Tax=Photobacterium profundum (strain SS9) TaxID=298386 RepID=Q6LKP0_PHOPR|nr:S24 family peptidase [Photobacterium profundum]CAG21962.1 putative prophage MuSo1, transcriptional regulator, Cro/CI family [Photobacterium profundum SS9]